MFEESRVGHLRHLEERATVREDVVPGGTHDVADAGSIDATWPLARMAVGARLVGDAFGEPALGRLAAGAPADLVVLDAPMPTPVETATLPGHWIFGLSARAVRDVMVAGMLVVRPPTRSWTRTRSRPTLGFRPPGCGDRLDRRRAPVPRGGVWDDRVDRAAGARRSPVEVPLSTSRSRSADPVPARS
jgi:hypothetical protein